MNNRNVVIIILDTVRADALRMYGGSVRLRNIAGIAKKGITYDMAIAPGTYTLTSHLSMFLGKRAKRIAGIKTSGMKFSDIITDPLLKKSRYGNGEMTLAKAMEYFGYKSALFSNNPFVSEATGLAEGFSYLSNSFIQEKIRYNRLWIRSILHLIQNDSARKSLIRLADAVSRPIPERRFDAMYIGLRKKLNRHFSDEYGYYALDSGAEKTNRQLDRYLKGSDCKRNFIVMNYMEGHEGYPTNLITGGYVEQDKWLHMIGESGYNELCATRTAYERRLEYLDSKIGEAIEILRSNGILEDAKVIITSDHGQAFMEHGQMFHSVFPYNEVARVPLIVSEFESGVQISKMERMHEPFSLTDLKSIVSGGSQRQVQPVFSDHTGIIEVWDAYLLKLIRSRSRRADMIYRKKVELDKPATAIFHGNYKLMHYYGRRKDELYGTSDIREEENVIDGKRSVALRMLALNKIM